jgi:hypothetical protein
MADPILVWRFDDAPAEFSALSTNGGDEDWVAVVPAEMAGDYIAWLDFGRGGFGLCDVSSYTLPDGRAVYIGSHA